MNRSTTRLRGLDLLDVHGAPVGRVADTWPLDGSGEADFAVVHVGHFARPRLVPLHLGRIDEEALQVPFTRFEIEDAPLLEDDRHFDKAGVARSYWSQLTDAEALGYDAVARERLSRRAAVPEPYPLVYGSSIR